LISVSILFYLAYKQIETELKQQTVPALFSYWDEFGNNPLPLDDIENSTTVLRLIDRSILNQLANKRTLAQLIVQHQLQGAAPITYNSKEEALKHNEPTIKTWFIKDACGTAGKNMHCVHHTDLEKEVITSREIIQAEITDIELIEGKKFTSRVYLFIWSGRLFLYRAPLLIHSAKLFPTSELKN
jgi:hypothetical protein